MMAEPLRCIGALGRGTTRAVSRPLPGISDDSGRGFRRNRHHSSDLWARNDQHNAIPHVPRKGKPRYIEVELPTKGVIRSTGARHPLPYQA